MGRRVSSVFSNNYIYYHQHHGVRTVSHLFFIHITGCQFLSLLFSITSRVIPSFLISSFFPRPGSLEFTNFFIFNDIDSLKIPMIHS